MAVNLNAPNETRENIHKQVEHETAIKFKLFYIFCVVLSLALVAMAGMKIKSAYDNVQDISAQQAKLEADYATLKSEAAAWHEENDAIRDDAGVRTEEKDMYSAHDGGNELADLMTTFYMKGGLTSDEKSRMAVLTGNANTAAWYGGPSLTKLSPATNPLKWRFDTFYDATVPTYDCIWSCWYTETSGTEYLVALKIGSYDGETGKFKIDSDMYYSDFLWILENSTEHRIEVDPNAETTDPDLQQAVDDLAAGLGDGNTETGTDTGVVAPDDTETGEDSGDADPPSETTGDGAAEPGSEGDATGETGETGDAGTIPDDTDVTDPGDEGLATPAD